MEFFRVDSSLKKGKGSFNRGADIDTVGQTYRPRQGATYYRYAIAITLVVSTSKREGDGERPLVLTNGFHELGAGTPGVDGVALT